MARLAANCESETLTQDRLGCFAWYASDGYHEPNVVMSIGMRTMKQLALLLIVVTLLAIADSPALVHAATTLHTAAVGDLCGANGRCSKTAPLAEGSELLLPLGDEAYRGGTLQQFTNYYDPFWGVFNPIADPAPGNHEYRTTNAQGYRDYFGFNDTQKLYRSFDRNGWHFLQLDTTRMTSAQVTWASNDLAADTQQCEVAYGHHPRYSSGANGNQPKQANIWNTFAAAGGDIYLVGHDHDYERVNRDGVQEFIVGTGGESLNQFGTITSGSQFRYNANYGVLLLDLNDDATYSWQFVTINGAVIDSGNGACR
jgi:hypothetical protein